jgi:hypothetical protein
MTSAFYFSRLFISQKSRFLNKKPLFCIPASITAPRSST